MVDWAIDKKSETERHEEDEKRRNLTWRGVIESVQRNNATREALGAWTPREIIAPLSGALDLASPEAAILEYLDYWMAENYGGMGRLSVNFVGYSHGKLAGQARSDAGPVKLLERRFVKLEHSTPAAAHAEVRVKVNGFGREAEGVLRIGCLRLLPDGDVAMPNDPNGRWSIMQKVVWDAHSLLKQESSRNKT